MNPNGYYIYLPRNLVEQLESFAKGEGVSPSAIVRKALAKMKVITSDTVQPRKDRGGFFGREQSQGRKIQKILKEAGG